MSSQHIQQKFHRSSISQHSRSVSQYISVSDLDELSDEELLRQVATLKRDIKILHLENEVLERTIMRLEPALMHGVQQALEYAIKLQSCSSLNVGSFVKSNTSKFGIIDSPSKLLTSPSRVSTKRVESSARLGGTIIFGSGPKINVLERSELATMETEYLIRRVEKSRRKAAKKHALLKAQLEEIGIRNAEVEKATESFNRQVILEGWDKIAKRIPAEVWIRYMNEWVGLCDKEIGKLRLRTSTANTQFVKYKGQIAVKSELAESLRPVDFDKLKIENQVCLETIDKKLVQLKLLKRMTGDANLNLAIHKQALMEQNNYLTKVQDDIQNKHVLTKQLAREKDKIATQAEELQTKYEEVKRVRMAWEAPDIIDYVAVKSELTELTRSVKLLENRLHIQQIALKSLNKQIQSMFFD